ncbi:MAG: extracellular solute-binding protein [Candidatus Eremiobacteraeota bacterium]|nr:extracellular solute-binding protein [Candidatus Eremiobacteraeota bacterium]
MLKSLVFLLLAALPVAPRSDAAVNVVYAGSLVSPMEGAISTTFTRQTGVRYLGEGKGSIALERLIEGGIRNPDVFISADPKVLDRLLARKLISSYIVFGRSPMTIGYSPTSSFTPTFQAAAAGRRSLLDVLLQPKLRIGRTDPQLDPKGARSIRALNLLAKHENRPQAAAQILGADENPAQVFPEEALLVRLESGDIDAAFLYSTEARARRIPAITLPGNDGAVYAIAVLTSAKHRDAAQTFVDFLLRGSGRQILEQAGINYLALHTVTR